MRKTIYTFIVTAVAVAFTACSNVDDDERFEYVQPADVNRCVLIEDYTGQMCVNCPKAAPIIEQLHETYGDNVIAVGIHGGQLSLADGTNGLVGLRTDDGEKYYENVGKPAQPSGRVNRKGSPVSIDLWTSLVQSEITMVPPLSLDLTAAYDDATRTVTVNVNSLGIHGFVGKLQLWFVEDNIVGPQMMPDGSANFEYVHNHVLRGSINGTWGEQFDVPMGAEKSVSHTASLDSKWKSEDTYIVAFVYNDNGVQQAAKIPVVAKSTETEE